MQLRKISTKRGGFTLVEILVVLSILGMLAFVSLNWGFDVYRTYVGIDKQEKIIVDLIRERSEVMSGVLRSGIYFQNLLGEVNQETILNIPTEGGIEKYVILKTNGEIKW